MNAPVVKFNVVNQSFSIAAILKGISGVEGITLRGPFSNPNLLMTSWAQFLRVYGGYIPNSDFPLLCKRAFDRGAQLRINRIGHYTDITDASTLDAIKASFNKPKKLAFSAALVTSNSYVITINGVAITPVVFTTDSDTTMAAIATAIETSPFVQSAEVVQIAGGVTNDRDILIYPATNISLVLTGSLVTLGVSQATTTISDLGTISTPTGIEVFETSMKYEGLDYNKVFIQILNASNGDAQYFNMVVSHTEEPSLQETYANLTVPGNPTIANSHFLDDVKTASALLDFNYIDLSGTAVNIRPSNGLYYFNGGSDGTTPNITDYSGDSASSTGFYAFDAVDDMLQIAAPEMHSTTLHIAGSAYSETRKDLVYFAHLNNANNTQALLVNDRQTIGTNSYYTAFFAGGLIITDPVTSAPKNISELGDILGIMAVNDEFGEWFSPAGTTRGLVINSLGVINNFGTTAKFNDLNILSNRQINMVIKKDGNIFLNGNYSAVLSNSKLSFLSAVRFLIYLQKSLSPTLTRYLQEPLDLPTMKAMFLEVEPFLDSLVTARAWYSYRWDGDQDVKKIEDVQVNNLTDIDNGKYKVKLYMKLVPSMQEIAIDLVVTSTSVSFE